MIKVEYITFRGNDMIVNMCTCYPNAKKRQGRVVHERFLLW